MNNFLTVEQLISELQKYPKDLQVLVDGYEDGLDAALSTKIVNVVKSTSKIADYRFSLQYAI